MLAFSLLLLPPAEARTGGWGDYEWNILQPTASVIAPDGVNLTILLRGQVTTFGNATSLQYQLWYSAVPSGPLTFVVSDRTMTYPHVVNVSANLEPEQTYVLGFQAWNAPTEDNTGPDEVLYYTVPSLVDAGFVPSHPFGPGILGLGLPVDITLASMGLIWLVLVFVVVAWYKMDTDTTITSIMVITSFNIFMRFWPAVLLVLLSFLLGYLVVREFKGRGLED